MFALSFQEVRERVVFVLTVFLCFFSMGACGDKGTGSGDEHDAGENNNEHFDGGGEDAFICPPGRVVCEGVCCEENELCREGVCCRESRVCANFCCSGNEVCMGGHCHLKCTDGVRCLDNDNNEMCCLPGEICFMNECMSPGAGCGTDADCALDEYCEESIGACLPIPESDCNYYPPPGEFTPVHKWVWPDEDDPPPMPDHVDVLTPPVVGDLNGDGVPEVVLVSYWDACSGNPTGGGASWNTGVLTILSGDTGEVLLQHDDPARRLRSNITPAIGDITLDGEAEIIVVGANRTMYCYKMDGTLVWESSHQVAQFNGGPFIADLDVDGNPEVVMGAQVFNNLGELVCAGTEGTGGGGHNRAFSTAADLNLDGNLEIVAGNTAYYHDCTVMWQNNDIGDGYPAVADILDENGEPGTDGWPEVAVIHDGELLVLNGQDGSLLWSAVMPGTGYGGAPNIGDFNGDGTLEVGSAGGDYMVVLKPGAADPVLWQQPTQDGSSHRTGSTVFDFEGDGEAEIIYSDECFVRIYKGSDGTVLFEAPNNTRTQHEYPIVVDVDGNGKSELLVTANGCVWGCQNLDGWYGPARRGVMVYEDAQHNWVRTRKVWNQHAYHVTNIRDNMSIPSPALNNWQVPGLNNFRQNVQTWGVHNAPNAGGEMFGGTCSADEIILGLMVVNRGSKGIPALMPVGFYRVPANDERVFIGEAYTQNPLLPGMTEYVEFAWSIPADEDPVPEVFHFIAYVDDPSLGEVAINECDEDDNEVGPAEVVCGTVN